MKVFLMTIILVLIATAATAAPFLVCDAQSGVIKYNVEINGVVVKENHPAEPDGSVLYDLAGQSPGPYIFRLQAIGEGGYPSDWSLPLNATKPASSSNVRIVTE